MHKVTAVKYFKIYVVIMKLFDYVLNQVKKILLVPNVRSLDNYLFIK